MSHRLLIRSLLGGAITSVLLAGAAAAEDPSVCMWRHLPAEVRATLEDGPATWNWVFADASVQAATLRAVSACGLVAGPDQIDAFLSALPAYGFELRQRKAFEAAGGSPARLDAAWATLTPEQQDALHLKDPNDRRRFSPVMRPLVNGMALTSQEQALAAVTFFMARARRAAADAVLAP